LDDSPDDFNTQDPNENEDNSSGGSSSDDSGGNDFEEDDTKRFVQDQIERFEKKDNRIENEPTKNKKPPNKEEQQKNKIQTKGKRKRGKDEEGKSKKPKKEKDPNEPKGAKNSYIFFTEQSRNSFKSQYPNANGQDLNKLMSEKWKTLTNEEKKIYMDLAMRDRERFQKRRKSNIIWNKKTKQFLHPMTKIKTIFQINL